MYGGRIHADEDGNISGVNASGRADAAFLNALGIKWIGNGNTPDLITLYSSPEHNIGFNMSLNDAINRSSVQEDILINLLERIILARESDAKKHNPVHKGHAYIYALTKFLLHHYISSLNPREIGLRKMNFTPSTWSRRKTEEQDHWINVYEKEFFNKFGPPAAPPPTSHSVAYGPSISYIQTQSPPRVRDSRAASDDGGESSSANSSNRGRGDTRSHGRASRSKSKSKGVRITMEDVREARQAWLAAVASRDASAATESGRSSSRRPRSTNNDDGGESSSVNSSNRGRGDTRGRGRASRSKSKSKGNHSSGRSSSRRPRSKSSKGKGKGKSSTRKK